MSDKVKSQHIGRKALLYVRQSSTYQVNHNLESQKLQYAMRQRLHILGWREIEVIDEDLGCSAAGTVTRSGFERMVAEVCMGKVGAVAAREVSRFARNSREWQQLVEVCRVVDTILVDQETIYDPRQSNDRLLLGLKGSLNEYELDLLRQRSLEARRQKARRGELIVRAPVGYVKSEGRLEKDPDRRVQEAILSVYSKFSELGTVRQTLLWFLEHDLLLPVQTVEGEIDWKRPRYATVYHMLTNPAYGGAYAYGKTEHVTEYEDGEPRQRCRHKARKQWLVLIPNTHAGYVSWEQFEQVQLAIGNNVRGWQQSGAVQKGAALLGGLLRCRRCGRKLMVQYSGERGDIVRYGCKRGWLDNGQPRCIAFGGTTVDEAIGQQLLRVVQPAAVESAIMASEEEVRKRDEVLEALKRDLEAARYAAQRAQKQYDHADPENRLVADELERRWNVALQRVRELETRIDQHCEGQKDMVVPRRQEFLELASELQTVWENPSSDIRLKKRIVQTLIHEIVADVDAAGGEVHLVIHWKGGAHTQLCLPRRHRGQHSCQTPKEVVDTIRTLAHTCTDEVIAGALNRNNLLTAHGNRWTRELVASLRSTHQIPRYTLVDEKSRDWMNLTKAADFLSISSTALRHAAQRGEIQAEHPLREGPWLFSRVTLESEAAKQLVNRIQHSPYSHKTDSAADEPLLFNVIARCAL
jgi:DNA invertase Pin-like site-specific DNA recombinase